MEFFDIVRIQFAVAQDVYKRQMLRMVATRSISVFASFQGSVSAKYLLPIRARFIDVYKRQGNNWLVKV